MKYLFDNSISFRFALMLRALEVDVVGLREEFPQDINDIDLFQALKGRSVVFISSDTSQISRKLEAAALRQSGVSALYLGRFWGKMTFWEQAIWLVRHWRRLDGFADAAVAGTCAEVKQNGRMQTFQPRA